MSPVARDLWSKTIRVRGQCYYISHLIGHCGIHGLYIVHMKKYLMYIKILHFVHAVHHNTLTHYKIYMMREL